MKYDIYDQKLIILDIDFWDLSQQNVDDYKHTKKFLNELAANQNVIIATNNSTFFSLNYLEKIGLKSGYLISDAGTMVTNMANQKPLEEGKLERDLALQICKYCVWNNIYFSIITDKTQYPVNIPSWIIKKYKSNLSHIYEYTNNAIEMTPAITKLAKQATIRRIEIYCLKQNNDERMTWINKIIDLFGDEIEYTINECFLHILPKNKTKSNGVNRIMKELSLNLAINTDGIYAAINQYDDKISSQVWISIKNPNITENRNSNSIVEHFQLGASAWVDWFYKHDHLWVGDNTIRHLEEYIKKHHAYSGSENDLMELQLGKSKFMPLTAKSDNALSSSKTIKFIMWPHQAQDCGALIRQTIVN